MGSVSDSLTIIGELGSHEQAPAFAEVVRRVHHRYATEIVGEFALCPFMKDPDTAFGKFVVVLSRELDVPAATQCVLEAGTQVVHLIYPLTSATAAEFERFGNALHDAITARASGGPVHAAFHPQMVGSTTTAAKLVGVVRRAPDPFVQFIPEGLHKGGSTFIDLDNVDLASLVKTMPKKAPESNAKSNFERLNQEDIRRIHDTIASIHEDRDRSYAQFLKTLADV
jgi:hypothetical protein